MSGTATDTAAQARSAAAQQAIGRLEIRQGRLTPELAAMLGAAVSHDRGGAPEIQDGAPMPGLWHWAAFPDLVPQHRLGRDGHPATGGFLPDLGLPRRMWAGGQLSFRGSLHIGEPLRRHSEIRLVEEKQGGSGRMALVRIAHLIEGAQGARIEEEQDIVYLEIPDSFRPPRPVPAPADPAFDIPVAMPQTRLFRFSAATFNAHRIHYDLPYARGVERYPALVVHGPLQAILLMDAGRAATGRRACRFRFRGLHPMFHDADLRLMGRRDGRAAMDLFTAAPEGHVGMQARMEWDG